MKEALKLALEALKTERDIYREHDEDGAPEYILDVIAALEALAQPEQDTCKGCNGNGVVGNILDTDTCPFCKGSGVEAQPEQEPVACVGPWHDGRLTLIPRYSHQIFEREQPLYTTPPQRKPLTDVEKAVIDAARAAMDASTEANDGEGSITISSELAASLSLCLDEYDRAIEAAHGIKE
jgi:hypothetical protein